jgi:hypothetical protein
VFYYIGCIIPLSVFVLHQLFGIPILDPQYQEWLFLEAKNCESDTMFLECILVPHTNQVWKESNMIFMEHILVITVIYVYSVTFPLTVLYSILMLKALCIYSKYIDIVYYELHNLVK